MRKVCKVCKRRFEPKPNRRGRQCASCVAEKNHQWYQANKKHVKTRSAAYARAHPELYRREALKSYYRHHARCRERNKRWIKRNLPKLNEYRKRRYREPAEMLKVRMRSRIHSALKRMGSYKNNRTMELLGCDKLTLFRHIESQFKSGMNWTNRGRWHVDHIKPLALFNLLDAGEMLAAFNYKNLQPLWARDNYEKGANYEDGRG